MKQRDHQRIVRRIRQEHAQEIAGMRNLHEADIQDLTDQYEKALVAKDRRIAELRRQLDELERDLSPYRRTVIRIG